MTKTYDLIVIGGGTAGNGVARMAADAGWSVASIDSEPHGGTCALRGCDPKKMLVAVTEGVEWAENMEGKGLEAQPSVNWPDMIAFKRSFTEAMPPRIEAGLEKAGIDVLHGLARFTGPNTIELNGETEAGTGTVLLQWLHPLPVDIDRLVPPRPRWFDQFANDDSEDGRP